MCRRRGKNFIWGHQMHSVWDTEIFSIAKLAWNPFPWFGTRHVFPRENHKQEKREGTSADA